MEINQRIREEARKLVPDGVDAACRAVIEANAMYALLAAEKRGREEAGKEFIERQNEINRELSEILQILRRSTN